jgi:flagellar basal-body rod modification protein FlgD
MSTPISTTSPVGTSATTSLSNPAAVLGQDGFLQLLVAEMQNQDPLSQSNQDPTQSVTQMAQFSSVEQLTNLVQNTQQAQSVSLIGHTVDYTDSQGNSGSGVVSGVSFSTGSPVLDVGGVAVAPSEIVDVQ